MATDTHTIPITRTETAAVVVFNIKTPEGREFSIAFDRDEDEQKIRAAAVGAFANDAKLPREAFTFTN